MITINTLVDNKWVENSTNDTTLTITQYTHKQPVILFYYDYTKGDESGFEITFGFKDSRIPEDKVFYMTQDTNGTVQQKTLTIQNEGSGVVPLPSPISAEEISITVSFIDSAGSPGTLTVWLIPDHYVF